MADHPLRPQTHRRDVDGGIGVWEVPRLPIILSHTGVAMDGMHRVAKALMLGHEAIDAIQFDRDPDPDWIDPATPVTGLGRDR